MKMRMDNLKVIVSGEQLQVKLITPESTELGQKVTLVFLHEALGSISQWRDFPEELGITFDEN